jgi:hypothetical protein
MNKFIIILLGIYFGINICKKCNEYIILNKNIINS